MRALTRAGLAGLLLIAATTGADAQRYGRGPIPPRGACFYESRNYSGNYFCYPVGSDVGVVSLEVNDKISSIRIFGRAEVTVYKDGRFRGASHRFTSSIGNLAITGFNDRISSFRVDDARGGWGGDRYDDYGGSYGGAYGGGGYNGGGHGGYGGGYGNGGGWGGAYGGGSHGGWGDDRGDDRRNNRTISYPEAQQIVRRAYLSTLRREPDAGGAQGWIVAVMKNGWDQRRVEAELRNSAEYREKFRR